MVIYFDDDENEDGNDEDALFCHIVLLFFIVSINQHASDIFLLMTVMPMRMSFIT